MTRLENRVRLFKGTGESHPYWSAAGSGQPDGLLETVDRAVSGTPAWVLTVTAGTVALVLLGMAYLTGRGLWRASERTRKRRQAELEQAKAEGRESEILGLGNMGRQAYVALGGMVVSIYGMWGFALGTAQLPEIIAVGFIAMFDAMELVLFSQLYQRANPKLGWTTQLRLIHNTAWALVAVSATANFIHAPNPVAAPFMAAMPIGAAWVIELEFRARMRGSEKVTDQSKAGPVRLLALLWTKGWAAAFSGLGLDPNSTSGQVARATLAKKASNQLFKLRTALVNHAGLLANADPLENRRARRRNLAKAVKELDAQRRKTTRAMDRSDFATDSSQALAVLRGLAGWTRVDDVATVDTADSTAVTQLMEEVAILPSAQRIEAAERAAELEEKAQRAEETLKEAEAARQRAEEEKRAALEEKQRAEDAREEAVEAQEQAKAEAENARQEAERAEDARKEAEAARQRAESEKSEESRSAADLAEQAQQAQDRVTEATRELEQVQNHIAAVARQREDAANEMTGIRQELEELRKQRQQARTQTDSAVNEVGESQAQIQKLQTALRALNEQYKEHAAAATRAADQREAAEEARRQAVEEAERARAEAREAADLLESLRPQLADRVTISETAAAPVFRSEAKQQGWEHYLAKVRAGQEAPTAAELAEQFKINDGNARNWILEFRSKRAEMIAAGPAREARGGEDGSGDGHAVPRAARDEPRASRAGEHSEGGTAAHPADLDGHRLSA